MTCETTENRDNGCFIGKYTQSKCNQNSSTIQYARTRDDGKQRLVWLLMKFSTTGCETQIVARLNLVLLRNLYLFWSTALMSFGSEWQPLACRVLPAPLVDIRYTTCRAHDLECPRGCSSAVHLTTPLPYPNARLAFYFKRVLNAYVVCKVCSAASRSEFGALMRTK